MHYLNKDYLKLHYSDSDLFDPKRALIPTIKRKVKEKIISIRHNCLSWKEILILLLGYGIGTSLNLKGIPLLHDAAVVLKEVR